MKATFELLENLFSSHYDESFGNSEDEIVEKEAVLGIKIPAFLREYYKKYGKCNYITQNCNNQYEPLPIKDFFIPGEDFFAKDRDYLIFYQCKESVIYCGIKFNDLQLEDPPVYLCVWDNPGWYLENNSLSNFLVCKAFIQIAVERRFPYWVYFRESRWNLSDYRKVWELYDESTEIKEITPNPAWSMFIKGDVLVVFESALDENEDLILGVSLASFNKENVRKMLLSIKQSSELALYQTNLPAVNN